jgi:hypothetical protein
MNAVRIAVAALLFTAWGVAHAHIQVFTGTLAPEATGATGSGTVRVEYEEEIHALTIEASFSGLSGTVTQSHIHCCTTVAGTGNAGVAVGNPSLTGFPLGVQSGNFLNSFDLSTTGVYGAAFLASNGGAAVSAEAFLIAGMLAGKSYLNIHTTTFGPGEIRAYLTLTPVPEPESYALMIAGLGLLGCVARARRR